jgi:hypothetical protein
MRLTSASHSHCFLIYDPHISELSWVGMYIFTPSLVECVDASLVRQF